MNNTYYHLDPLLLDEVVSNLEDIFACIQYDGIQQTNFYNINPSNDILDDMKNSINKIIPGCTDIDYTINTDKLFFGIHVNPKISTADAMKIILTEDPYEITSYQIEFDSKLFDLNLSTSELVAYLLFEVSSMVGNTNVIDQTRALIDLHVMSDDTVINIRNSTNYSQLIIFGLKDTIYKISSALYKEDPEELNQNIVIQTANLQDFLTDALQKIFTCTSGISDSVRGPKNVILKWVFLMYRNVPMNYEPIIDTLNDAKLCTGSRLQIKEIDNTIRAVDNIVSTSLESFSLSRFFDKKNISSLNEISLFKLLKANGLRSIEDSYYEFAMQIKNCETEDEALWILRGINSRLNILEDYLYNTPDLSENERNRWELLAIKYRELRNTLSKKKIWNKKQYGIFVDYNKLDQLGDE